mgnify:CR=1 FL=1
MVQTHYPTTEQDPFSSIIFNTVIIKNDDN